MTEELSVLSDRTRSSDDFKRTRRVNTLRIHQVSSNDSNAAACEFQQASRTYQQSIRTDTSHAMYKYAPILLELGFNERDSNHKVLQYVFFLGII